MRIIQLIVIFLLIWSIPAFGMQWQKGVITRDAWMDQGGYYVSVDNTIYLFMHTATILVDSKNHEIPNRLAYLTKGSKVRILKDGFRIYALEIEWRKKP